MVVKIRFARFGPRHSPFYNIVVAQARSARDSKPLEVVGTYNPLPQKPTNLSEEEAKVAKAFKEISIDRSRVKYWLGVGAQPTDSVWRLLSMAGSTYQGIPLIIHHVLLYGYNNNAFISPYNKLSSWVKSLQEKGLFTVTEKAKNPETPVYSIPGALYPQGGSFGGSNIDEILLPKFQTSSFGSSDFLGYLRARGIRHVVLCGLTTIGAILGSARHGADLDYHAIIPRTGVMDDESDVNDFILQRVLPKFVDIVDMKDVKDLFTRATD
ncbi:hypothetical protein TCE0_018r05694 [Talaromyces pinophilus]|uniref:Isochorismatase-like domain-containing protein n=1 Tax=Talaromyces pinophilus TaxID=128442 RepID=A0A510NX22_TALPI|nr:hypothetical protein TCE0_018r05694 [Talaromyces pinophilus]